MRLLIFVLMEALIVLVIMFYLTDPIPWFRQQFTAAPAATETSDDWSQAAQELPIISANANHHHPRIPPSRCFSPPTRALAAGGGSQIYRWEDERGQVNFTDFPPPGVQARLLTPSLDEPQYFTLNVQQTGLRQIPFLRSQIEVNARRIFLIFRELLGEARLRQVDMDITIFEHRQEFQQHAINTGVQRSANALGYYRLPQNTVFAFQQPEDQRTLNTVTHEAVHVMVAGMLGPTTPLWLNEGLATYFSSIEVRAQYGLVPPNPSLRAMAQRSVSNGYPGRLIDFLEQDSDEWNNRYRDVHYALAWSVTYFLLGSDQGRQAITALMQLKADAFCEQPDHQLWLARFYPGGVNGLQRDFYRWLASGGELGAHQY